MFPEYSLNVHLMFPECSLNVDPPHFRALALCSPVSYVQRGSCIVEEGREGSAGQIQLIMAGVCDIVKVGGASFHQGKWSPQSPVREHLGNIQGTFREHSGNIQGTFITQ
jgi:hypothetical protein